MELEIENVEKVEDRYWNGTLSTEKYSPLNIKTALYDDKKAVTYLQENRVELLKKRNIFSSTLFFSCSHSLEICQKQTDEHPAMFVISSGRSAFIKEYITLKISWSEDLDYTTYIPQNYLLWYSPQISKRRVFIVVNQFEYEEYQNELSKIENEDVKKQVILVGWKFGEDNKLLGFGASRFAAIYLAKVLKFSKVWLVDDNVFMITGFPRTLNDIEDFMHEKKIVALSFEGSTKRQNFIDILSPKDGGKYSVNFNQSLDLKDGFIQQVSLWNIEYLNNENILFLNFSPFFIRSSEDLSFSFFLKNFLSTKYKKETNFIVPNLKIIKINPWSLLKINTSLKKGLIELQSVLINETKNIKIKKDVSMYDFIHEQLKIYLKKSKLDRTNEPKFVGALFHAAEQIYTNSLKKIVTIDDNVLSLFRDNEIVFNWVIESIRNPDST